MLSFTCLLSLFILFAYPAAADLTMKYMTSPALAAKWSAMGSGPEQLDIQPVYQMLLHPDWVSLRLSDFHA